MVHADPFTGVATTSIPIEVSPGRNGMQPNLALTYGDKAFVVKMAGITGELVPSPPPAPSNKWSAKIEGGFSRIQQVGTGSGMYWIVTTKQGRKHYFGQTADAKQTDPNNPANIFGWLLNRVEDTDGNYMTFSYWIDNTTTPSNNQVYLDHIDYAGNTTTGAIPTHTLKLWRDDGVKS